MRKYVLILVVALAGITSCIKTKEIDNTCPTYNSCNKVAPAAEVTKIEEYLTDKNITGAVKHCSGMYYKITDPGSDTAHPTVCSQLLVNYRGEYINGVAFDSLAAEGRNPVEFNLSGVITGWQNSIPLLKRGGSIQLFIPPALGYGYNDYMGIPASSILIFNVKLLDFL